MTALDFINTNVSNGNLDPFAFFKTFTQDTVNGGLGGVNAFLNKVSTAYNTSISQSTQTQSQVSTSDSQLSELKKETYYNIKSIYDKISISNINNKNTDLFIANGINGLKKLENIDISKINLFYQIGLTGNTINLNNKYDLYQIFRVVDRSNNDIGTESLANLAYLYENLYSDFLNDTPDSTNSVSKLTNYTVDNLLSGLAKSNGFLYQRIPSYLNLNSVVANTGTDQQVNEVVDQLFGVHTNTELFGNIQQNAKPTPSIESFYGGLSGFPGYIFQIGTTDSVLSDVNRTNNNNLDSFCLDVKMHKNQTIISDESIPNDIKNSNVTSFTVDFGKQNQQMFNTINLDTNQFMWTEEALKTWVNYVGSTNGVTQAANLFPVFEKRSYTCTIGGMGNATIQPLTYFYLRNVPLFHGTYWITNVKHSITANTIHTEFTGVRQPIATKNDVRLALLNALKKTADEIKKLSNQVNTIVTEGIQDTGGIVRKVANSGKPFPDFIQNNASGFGTTLFDGKTILGAYVYSITNDNDRSAVNMGILATLYNSSKGLNSNTENYTTILAGMVDIAVGNMLLDAINGGTRYDDNAKGLSLSKLFKLSGNGYNTSGDLSTLLDDISTSLVSYTNAIVVPKTDKAFTVKATGKGGTNITRDNDNIVLTIGTNIPLYNNFDLIASNLFIETNNPLAAPNKTNNTYPAIPNSYVLYDIINSLSSQDDNLTDINKEVLISGSSVNNLNFIIKRPITDITTLPTYQPNKKNNAWVDFILNSDRVQKNIEGLLSAPDESGITQTNALKIYYNSTIQLIKFALFDSDGTFDLTKFKIYLKSVYNELANSTDSDLNNLINQLSLPLNQKTKTYQKALFFDFSVTAKNLNSGDFLPIIGGDLSTTTNTFSFSFNDVNYSFSSGDNNLEGNVELAYRAIGSIILQSWIANANNTNKQPVVVKVKYKGSYQATSSDSTKLPSVTFFQTTYNGIKSGVIYDQNIKKYYTFNSAITDALGQNSSPKAPVAGNLRSEYQTKIVQVLNGEYNKWNNGNTTLLSTNCDNTTMTGLLNNYFTSAGTTLQAQGGCSGNLSWSAPFISYAIKNSNVIEFPYTTNESVFIKKARDNKNTGGSYSWYGYDAATTLANVEVGDLLCYTKGKSVNINWSDIDPTKNTDTHCDCVVAIDTTTGIPYAKVMGGNVLNTVKDSIVYLQTNGTIDLSNSLNKINGIYRGVLKYQPIESSVTVNVTNYAGTLNDLISSAGYDPKSTIGVMASAIATQEGYTKKSSVGYLINNPGNLDYQSSFKKIDASVTFKVVTFKNGKKHTFAVFSTAQLGMKALIETKIKNWANGNMPPTASNGGEYANIIGTWKPGQPPTFLQFFYTYAPPSDENMTNNYVTNVVTTINTNSNTNYTVQTLVKDAIA